MVAITIKNIPESVINKIKDISFHENMSMNNKIIAILTSGISHDFTKKKNNYFSSLSSQLRAKTWRKIAKQWDDTRSAKQITEDIYKNRSEGRSIHL